MKSQVEELLGRKVATYRTRSELTQEALAEKVGVAPETISRLERGASVPSLRMLEKIAHGLHVELRDLFDFRDSRSPKDRALDELVHSLRGYGVEDIELVHDLAMRILQHFKD